LEELLHQTTNLLAQVTQHAAVVVGPRAETATVRSVQIVGLSARHAMVVAVFSNGTIDSQTIDIDPDMSDVRISAASRICSRRWSATRSTMPISCARR
jgi:heat-inducible transcriptional repressor